MRKNRIGNLIKLFFLPFQTQPNKKNASSSLKKEEKEKLIFYQYEMKRYRSYVEVLEKRHNMDHAEHELVELQVLPNPPVLMEEES
jgi:hypothetical protein